MNDYIESFLEVIAILDNEKIPYMVVGSFASMIYGEPRLTHDMDLVVDVLPSDAIRIEKIFRPEEFYCPPLEVLKPEIIHRGQFNLIHSKSGLKVDIIVRKLSPHAEVEFGRRKLLPFWEAREVFVASAEDVIIKKLDYFREGGSEKHLKDIRGILCDTVLDMSYLLHWIKELSLEKYWLQVEG